MIRFFMLSFYDFVFTNVSLLHPVSVAVLHTNLALLWWVAGSINHTGPLFLWFLHTFYIFSCDYQHGSFQRCCPKQFSLSTFLPKMTGLGIICHGLLSLISFSGTIISNFYSFHSLEKLCGCCIIFQLENKAIQHALFCTPIGNRVVNVFFQFFCLRDFTIYPDCNKGWCNH